MGGGKIQSCALCQPSNRANDTLVLFLAFDEGGAVVSFVGLRVCINGKAQTIGSGARGDIACVDDVVFDEVRCKAGLAKVD